MGNASRFVRRLRQKTVTVCPVSVAQAHATGNAPRVKIPLDSLSAEALAGIIESFVLREGTDYGEREVALARKCADVRRQLERGEAYVDFDPDAGSVDIRPAPAPPRRH